MKHEIKSQSFSNVSDDDLLRRLGELLQKSRRVEADLVAHIGEVDARRLYAREAASSMFVYCTERLNLSEHEAYLRIKVARHSREHPQLLEMLAKGRLPLSAIARLAPHLTKANREAVLSRAAGKSKREIEELIAELSPSPDVPATIRKLPERSPKRGRPAEGAARPSSAPLRDEARQLPDQGQLVPEPASGNVQFGTRSIDAKIRPDSVQLVPEPVTFLHTPAPAPTQRPVVQPLAPARYRVQFTASAELREKLNRLQALMRTSVPDGDLATIIEEAVNEKLERLEAKRFAKTKSPRKTVGRADTRPKSRYIPAPVRREVQERDGNQCTFVSKNGKRCSRRGGLEFHHKNPFARGGDHSPENLRLVCRTHNIYYAELDYGEEVMGRYKRSGSRVSEPLGVYCVGLPSRSSTPLVRWSSEGWCRRGDSNPHGSPHTPLKRACLPVPPLRRLAGSSGSVEDTIQKGPNYSRTRRRASVLDTFHEYR
jgi:hypothetical protein